MVMTFVHGIILLFHFIGFAAVFGGAFVQVRGPKRVINPAMMHGAWTLLISGLLLVTSLELFSDAAINHMKIGIKLLVLIVLVVLILINRKKSEISSGTFFAILGMTLANAAIAVLW